GRCRGGVSTAGGGEPGGDRSLRVAARAARPGLGGCMVAMAHFTIATVAEQSADFRRGLWTGKHTQLVIMTIPPGGEIGEEVHEGIDQILSFVSGTREARAGGETKPAEPADLVLVPARTTHNFVNTGPSPLVLYTVHGPPAHAPGAVHRTKEEADAAEESGEDEPPTS